MKSKKKIFIVVSGVILFIVLAAIQSEVALADTPPATVPVTWEATYPPTFGGTPTYRIPPSTTKLPTSDVHCSGYLPYGWGTITPNENWRSGCMPCMISLTPSLAPWTLIATPIGQETETATWDPLTPTETYTSTPSYGIIQVLLTNENSSQGVIQMHVAAWPPGGDDMQYSIVPLDESYGGMRLVGVAYDKYLNGNSNFGNWGDGQPDVPAFQNASDDWEVGEAQIARCENLYEVTTYCNTVFPAYIKRPNGVNFHYVPSIGETLDVAWRLWADTPGKGETWADLQNIHLIFMGTYRTPVPTSENLTPSPTFNSTAGLCYAVQGAGDDVPLFQIGQMYVSDQADCFVIPSFDFDGAWVGLGHITFPGLRVCFHDLATTNWIIFGISFPFTTIIYAVSVYAGIKIFLSGKA